MVHIRSHTVNQFSWYGGSSQCRVTKVFWQTSLGRVGCWQKKPHICTCICNGITSQREWGQKIQVDIKYAVSQCHNWNRNSIISMTVWYVYTSKYTGGSEGGSRDNNGHRAKSNGSNVFQTNYSLFLLYYAKLPKKWEGGKGGHQPLINKYYKYLFFF